MDPELGRSLMEQDGIGNDESGKGYALRAGKLLAVPHVLSPAMLQAGSVSGFRLR